MRGLRAARLGFLGHTYPGMLDMYSDFTQVHAQAGAHVEVLEIDDLVARVEAAGDDEIERKGDEIRAAVRPRRPGRRPDRRRDHARAASSGRRASPSGSTGSSTTSRSTASPTTTAALGGNVNERVSAGLIVGNSLLTARGVPASGEGDLKTNVAMLLMDRLGAGGSYTEFYALDFDEEFVLMGHDGPGHVAIADGRPVLRALKLYHGKSGAGPLGRVQGAPRAGDDPRPLADRRRAAEAARRRGRVDRGADVPDRQHELAHPLRARPGRVHGRLVRRGPDAPRRARASATSSAASARSPHLLGLELAVVG